MIQPTRPPSVRSQFGCGMRRPTVATVHQAIRWAMVTMFAGWAPADEIQRRPAADGFGDPTARGEAANRLLNDVVAELGADAAVRGRRVRAPR